MKGRLDFLILITVSIIPESYRDIFGQDDEDIRQTPVLEHTIETQGTPVRLPYRQ